MTTARDFVQRVNLDSAEYYREPNGDYLCIDPETIIRDAQSGNVLWEGRHASIANAVKSVCTGAVCATFLEGCTPIQASEVPPEWMERFAGEDKPIPGEPCGYPDKDSQWYCPDCGETTRWTWLQVEDSGIPVCSDCDEDMHLDLQGTLRTVRTSIEHCGTHIEKVSDDLPWDRPGNDEVSAITRYEEGGLSDEETVELFQRLINSGLCWRLQGSYGQQAMRMLAAGVCVPAPTPPKTGGE